MHSQFFRTLGFALLAILLIMAVPGYAVAQFSSGPLQPQAFHRSMVFVDGTNLFYRFEELKLTVSSFYNLLTSVLGGRHKPSIMRICWYTIEEKYERTLKIHGANCLDKIRVIFGIGAPTSGSEPKEKGVDSLLVADLVYHAAMKNFEYAQLVSIDLDFVYAIRRVEDFGCRTGVLAIGYDAPPQLQKSCDDYRMIGKDDLVKMTSLVQPR